MTMYLTGVSNTATRQAARDDLYGRLGVLLQPNTAASYAAHIPDYSAWAFDNGCFGNEGGFNEALFLGMLEVLVESVDSAHERCLFAVSPDVFDPIRMAGDPVATIKRSLPVFPKIRALGVPAALVAQDGLQHMISEVPWDDFDVLFLGGSDQFKLGYPDRRIRGLAEWRMTPAGAINEDTRAWARLMAEAVKRDKPIHVGRVNSAARFAFCRDLGADSADGTYLAYTGPSGLSNITHWLTEVVQ